MKAGAAVALATSGLGPDYGGIGVVSRSVSKALGPGHALWRHHHAWPVTLRRLHFVAATAIGSIGGVRAVFYEHLDLAAAHAVLPWLKGKPYAVFLHGTEVWQPLTGRRREALQQASLLLANSRFTVEQARRSNPWLPPVRVVELGVVRATCAVPPLAARPPLALMVGRMASRERYKGHEQVLAAWRDVSARIPGAELKIVGRGDDASRLEELARGLEGVAFMGHVPDAELELLYAQARVLAFPSSKEGFGLVALEAAQRGALVLCLADSVACESLGVDAVLAVESAEPGHLAEALARGLGAPDLQAKADAARARVLAAYLEEHFVERGRAALAGWVD